MAESTWQTFRKTGVNILTSFESIALSLDTVAHLQIYITGQTLLVGTPLSGASAQPPVSQLLNLGQALAYQLSIATQLGGTNQTVQVRRNQTATDSVTISYSDQIPADVVLRLVVAVSKEFPTFARAESIDRLLGDELAEFYRAREVGLLKLETVAQGSSRKRTPIGRKSIVDSRKRPMC